MRRDADTGTKGPAMHTRTLAITAALLLGIAAAFSLTRTQAEPAVQIPPPVVDQTPSQDGLQTIVLAGGCFWGIQAVYQHTKGVTNAVSGYAGGSKADADYHTVSGGRTGHAESVQVTFDPHVVTLGKILQIYFSVAHDPTQIDGQEPDMGPQYRSEIFAQTDDQRKVAAAYIAQLDAAKAFPKPIATKVGAGNATFYPAEHYHQDYATLHPSQPYIAYFDLPKIEHLKQIFPEAYREKPVLVAQAKAKAKAAAQ
jgi:peptide-methionine (S)-S-oxide reductase